MRRALLLLTPLALLVPRASQACSPGLTPISVAATWPEDSAVDAPIDGVVMVLATDAPFTEDPEIRVFSGDVEVPGTLLGGGAGSNLYTWRAVDPFAAQTAYTVTVSGVTFSFTTGDAPAPEPVASAIDTVTLEQHDVEIRECAKGDGCTCDRWRTVDVETHMRARVTMPPPPGPFAYFTEVELEVAPAADQFDGEHRVVVPWPADGDPAVVDFGIAGTWPSDQVCTRATVLDPLDRRAIGEAICEPIGAINTPPEGCACATTGGPGGLASAFALGALLLVGRRRRLRPTA